MTGGPAIYVIDGHDVTLYPSPEDAAADIEGYDAAYLNYLGWTAPCGEPPSRDSSGVP